MRRRRMDALQILLSRERELPVQERDVKLKRLSRKGEEPVVFTLRSLSYNRVEDIKKISGDDGKLHIVLAGVKSPDLKNQELLDHYGAATPLDLIKLMLLPGEIEDLCREIEQLSGYRTATLEVLKKK
jgi:hypothetical protein